MAYSSMDVPSTILILGSGVFGLSTAHALINRPTYKRTRITLVSPSFPSSSKSNHTSTDQTASIDNTRIIRADYADPLYSRLARDAQVRWRGDWGSEGRYHETGLVITADEGSESYVKRALVNVKASEHGEGLGAPIREFANPAEIAEALNAPDGAAVGTGSTGYLNPHSGWADAGAAMRWLQERVEAERRVEFKAGEAVRLLDKTDASSGKRVIAGAELASGETVFADLTILATGAWTPKLLDLRGIASARGQCMAYIKLSKKEAQALKDMPVHLNMAHGCFFFPPTKDANGEYEIKVARHAFGYSNPTPCSECLSNESEPSNSKANGCNASIPDFPDNIPQTDLSTLHEFLEKSLPILDLAGTGKDRQIRTRMCWYLDTPTSDFLICYHPAYFPSLFLATGGSGHGYKFLPVLGEKIVDVLEGKEDREGMVWTEKWRWRGRKQEEDEVWCDDGSRGGVKGDMLKDALQRS